VAVYCHIPLSPGSPGVFFDFLHDEKKVCNFFVLMILTGAFAETFTV
jgi:hypothetical protein